MDLIETVSTHGQKEKRITISNLCFNFWGVSMTKSPASIYIFIFIRYCFLFNKIYTTNHKFL